MWSAGASMSEGAGVINEVTETPVSRQLVEPEPSPTEGLLMESITARLNVDSAESIPKMIHAKGKVVGAIITGYAVFWWLTVLKANGKSDFNSIFFDPTFMTVTIIAPSLVFLGSLLGALSREHGQLIPGLISGISLVLAFLYASEPAIMGLVGSTDMGDAVWMSGRLVILCSTIYVAAKLLIDAVLLLYLQSRLKKYPLAGIVAASDVDSLHQEEAQNETEA